LLGGRDSNNNRSDRAYYYDGEKDEFEEVKSIPCSSRSGVARSLSDGRVWLATGADDDWLVIYDPVTDEWEILEKEIGVGSGAHGLTGTDGNIHLFGGRIGKDRYRIYEVKKREWREETRMPKKRWFGGSAIDPKGMIYIYGGCWDDGYNDMIIYDSEQKKWTRGQDIPCIKKHFGCAFDEEGITIVGGSNYSSWKTYDTVSEYSFRSNEWMKDVVSLEHPVSESAAAIIKSQLHSFGGWDGNDTFKNHIIISREMMREEEKKR